MRGKLQTPTSKPQRNFKFQAPNCVRLRQPPSSKALRRSGKHYGGQGETSNSKLQTRTAPDREKWSDETLSGFSSCAGQPRVASPSFAKPTEGRQPGALLRNPFGIEY